MLYSFNNAKPQPLPFRIRLPDGSTRTDPSTFTQEELIASGYTGPYIQLPYDPKTEVLDWDGSEYFVRPHNTQELEDQWNKVRVQRNQLLKDSDWTQIDDYDLGLENKEQWATYRQKLRDLPNVQSNPFDIVWPRL